jgi:RNA-directed DNA polymerase
VEAGSRESQRSPVPARAKQEREVPARWAWTEPTVWTTRMLETLEKGVKGGKWFSLIDKVYSPANLRAAWERVLRNKGSAGVDQQSVEVFARHAERYLEELHTELREGKYRPMPALRRWIPKPGTQKMRPLGIPAVRDRVVQGALRNVLEPLWEARFADQSYGFRPRRSCRDALRRVTELLRSGHTWVVDADIQSCFDTIPQRPLMEAVEEVVSDGRVLALVQEYLEQSILEAMVEWTPVSGTPQGAVISPLLANIYLHPIDEAVRAAGFEMVRYADDLVILCRTEEEAQTALALLREQMTGRGLQLHPEKTRLVDADGESGFEFLGYHFRRGTRWPRKKSERALKEKLRSQTRRTNGQSLRQVIATVNPILRGWFGYFQHSHQSTFAPLDGWLRRRLRSLLRRHNHRRGCARANGADQTRWPNAFFTERGLFSLKDAHRSLLQSRCGNH